MDKRKILILGGGFAGVKAALSLSVEKKFEVTLVSDNADFRYYPALYRSATGGARRISSIPLKDILVNHSVKVVKDRAIKLDKNSKTVRLQSGKKLPYDSLVVALGMVTNYFGIKGLDQYSYGIKSIEEAEGFKLHLHQQMIDDQKPDLNYIVIGAGPTGVELAGALPGYLKHIMKLHGMTERKVHVEIVEAADRVMPRMPKDVSRRITKHLRSVGVTIHLNQKVQAETADALMVNGKPIKSHTVVWTAGVTNNPFFKENDFTLNDRGKVTVNDYLEASEDIYVLGDNADTEYSGLAQTALYDAVFVARNLRREAYNQALKHYRPKKPIYVTPAGPKWAAVLWNNFRLYGHLGWLLRRLADLVAYHDYEPWWQASQIWQAESLTEESCKLCSK